MAAVVEVRSIKPFIYMSPANNKVFSCGRLRPEVIYGAGWLAEGRPRKRRLFICARFSICCRISATTQCAAYVMLVRRTTHGEAKQATTGVDGKSSNWIRDVWARWEEDISHSGCVVRRWRDGRCWRTTSHPDEISGGRFYCVLGSEWAHFRSGFTSAGPKLAIGFKFDKLLCK